MKILVTGGAGFIGSHIVDQLTQAEHLVWVLDKRYRGKHPNDRAQYTRGEVRTSSARHLVQELDPEVIIHLAAQTSFPSSWEYSLHEASVNTLGTMNMLEAARSGGARRFILASTTAVYGTPPGIRAAKESAPTRPLSFTGASKLAAETYLPTYQGLETVVLRLASVYGPRQGFQGEAGVVAALCRGFLSGQGVHISVNGEQKQDFVYVGDVVGAFMAALAGPTGIYNICTGVPISIEGLYKIMGKAAGYLVPAIYDPSGQSGDGSFFDRHKARRELGWQAQTSLQEGLTKTLESFRQ